MNKKQNMYDMAYKIKQYCEKRTWKDGEPCKDCPLSIEYLYDNNTTHWGCALHDTPDCWEID